MNFSDPLGLLADCQICDYSAILGAKLSIDLEEATVRALAKESGSNLGARFVRHYFAGSGKTYTLSPHEFSEASAALSKKRINRSPGTREVSFYGTKLAGAFGRAKATFGKSGLTALSDRYDFNGEPWGTRSVKAELETRAVGLLGWLFGAKSFDIVGHQ